MSVVTAVGSGDLPQLPPSSPFPLPMYQVVEQGLVIKIPREGRSEDLPPGGDRGKKGRLFFVLCETLDLFTGHGDLGCQFQGHCTGWDSYEPTSFKGGGPRSHLLTERVKVTTEKAVVSFQNFPYSRIHVSTHLHAHVRVLSIFVVYIYILPYMIFLQLDFLQ